MDSRFIKADSAQYWLLAATMTVPFITFSRLNPVGTAWFGLLAGAALCLFTFTSEKPQSRAAAIAASALLASAAFFAARGLFATSPAVSLFGTVAQHNGASLWIAGACWFTAGVRLGGKVTLRRSIGIVSVAGAAYAIATVVEALTSGTQRDWGSAAGVFENSSSLGQIMALATGSAIAWALLARSKSLRWGAYAIAALCVAVTVLAQSRAGLLGIAFGGAAALLLHLVSGTRRGPLAFGVSLVAGGAGLSAIVVAASTGAFGSAALRLAASVGNRRDVIWRSALAAFRESPIAGRGLEQFSACVDWSFTDGRLLYNGTYDPHNAVLAVAVGGGVIGVLLAFFAAATVLRALARVHAGSGSSKALAALIGGMVAVPASGLVTWFAPVAVIAASYLAGSVAGSVPDSDDGAPQAGAAPRPAGRALRWEALAAAAVALVLAAYAVPGVVAEVRFDSMRRGGTPTAVSLASLTSWPDPTYAASAVGAYLTELGTASSAAEDGTALIDRWQAARRYHFDLAISSVVFEQAAGNATATDRWSRLARAVGDGTQADPATGIWDFLGALEADRLGKTQAAKTYAAKALAFPLGTTEKTQMEQIAGE